MARVFVGVAVPGWQAELARVVARLRAQMRGVRWVGEDTWHITLRFLGEVPEADLEALLSALSRLPGEPFGVRLGAVTGLPRPEAARVVAVTVGEGARELGTLRAEVERRLSALGYDREARPFLPHVTLGRATAQGVVRVPAVEVQPADGRVAEVVLWESLLRPQGAVYRPRGTFPLSGQGGMVE